MGYGLILIYLFFYIILLTYKYKLNNYSDCISLIIPSTEEDFYKCRNQFFFYSKRYKLAKEIVFAISHVKNFTKIKNLIHKYNLKNKIVIGLRSSNHNAASNRNYGYSLSHCNIISFIDIDDIMSINRLNIVYNVFSSDKTVEYVIHKYSKNCHMISKNVRLNANRNSYLYNISYHSIYKYYKKYSNYDKPNMRFCCKYIPQIKNERIHNGWPTMRRYIMSKIKYNENYSLGQDSDFNARVILSGFNIAIINISLGFYLKH